MKSSLFLLTASLLVSSLVRGQEADAPAPAGAPVAPAPRYKYHSTQLKDFPRDENGFLKPEIWDIIIAEGKLIPNSNEGRSAPMRATMKALYAKYVGWKAPEPPEPPPGKLRNLAEIPTKPRFELTDKVWPQKPGDASVCLWAGDKLAAMSLGVDDNCAMDLEAWQQIALKYHGLSITWNLITDNIDGVLEKGREPMSGTWKQWQDMVKLGYHVESHSMTHNHDPVPSDGWPGPDWEAAESQRLIDTNIPGHRTNFLAFPGSGIHALGIYSKDKTPFGSWRPSMVKYFVGARGGGSQPINEANMIDYFCIRSSAAVQNVLSDDPKNAIYNLNNLFAADPKNPMHRFYRGWANTFIHFINNGKDFDKNPYSKVLAFYDQHRPELWTGFFDDIGLYAAERDTATLKTDSSSTSKIELTLTSQMDPAVFNYPLTVKVRLPDAWKQVTATQGGKAIKAELLPHEGGNFALVDALPDKGQVTLKPGG
jgi:hypothetical protein